MNFVQDYWVTSTPFEDFWSSLRFFEQIHIQPHYNYSFAPQTTDFMTKLCKDCSRDGFLRFWGHAELSPSWWCFVKGWRSPRTPGATPHPSLPFVRLKIKKPLLGSWCGRPWPTQEVFYGPRDIYTKMWQIWLWNGWFWSDGKVYKNSFVTYENFSTKTMRMREIREKAFRSFSEGLRKHQNTAAATYLAQVKSENWLQICARPWLSLTIS